MNKEAMIVDCLKNEVVLAMGCTEPVTLALVTAHAANDIGKDETIQGIELTVSLNLLKNAMNVGVPRTTLTGLEIAACLGVYACPADGLSLLAKMSDQAVAHAHQLYQRINVKITDYSGNERIYAESRLITNKHCYRAVISGRHDQLVLRMRDDEIVYRADFSEQQQSARSYCALFDMPIVNLIELIDQMQADQLHFLMEGYYVNKEIADYGLRTGAGLGLGRAISQHSAEKLRDVDLIVYAMQMTAAASDARMSGADYPVMTSNGSGNNGLTAVLPIVAADMIYHFKEEQVVKALAMSHLINSYIKYYLGRLSSVCACAVASATGAAIGVGYLLSLPIKRLPLIINTMIANLSGIACDGAKQGCALKLSTAAAAGIQSVYLLQNGAAANQRDGIVGATPEQSIKNLVKLTNQGMKDADRVMTEILIEKLN